MKKTLLAAAVVVFAVLLLGSLAQAVTDQGNEPLSDEKKELILMVLSCLPRYRNEETVFSIKPSVNGEYLNCKRFEKVDKPAPGNHKAEHLIMAMGNGE